MSKNYLPIQKSNYCNEKNILLTNMVDTILIIKNLIKHSGQNYDDGMFLD